MATAYETEIERRKNAGLYQQILKQNKDRADQEKILRAPLEELVAGIHDPQEREQVIQSTRQDEELYSSILQNHLKKLDEEAKKAENLEEIIDSAPIEALGSSLQYIGPAKDAKDYGTLVTYNKLLQLARSLQESENNKEKLEKLDPVVKKTVRDYMLSDEYFDTKNEETKKFLETYTRRMPQQHYGRLFEQLIGKASKYVTSKDNADEVRGYVNEILKDETQRPLFYQILFSPRDKE